MSEGDSAWPRAVLFDLDGTLIDSAPAIAGALNAIRRGRGGEDLAVHIVRPWISLEAATMVELGLGPLALDRQADLRAFREVYGARRSTLEDFYDGAVEVLTELSERGLLLGLCTNKPQHLTEKILADCGLTDRFAAIVGGRPGEPAKPHPEPVRLCLSRMGVSPGDAAFVGDSETDAEAAMRAGVPFLLVTYGYPMGDLADIIRAAESNAPRDIPHALSRLSPQMTVTASC